MADPNSDYIEVLGDDEEEDEDEDEDEEDEDEDEDEEDEELEVEDQEGEVTNEDYATFLAGLNSYVVSEPEGYPIYLEGVNSSSVAESGAGNAIETLPRNGAEDGGQKRRRTQGGETVSLDGGCNGESSQGSQWNRSEIDGLFCPICLEAWTNDGGHHICCLPCGHIYGMSCIKKWLQLRKNLGKCPQCNRKFSLKDVRKLFASQIVSVDEESQKRIRSLEAKCDSLEKKEAGWCKKEAQWLKLEAELQNEVQKLKDRTTYLEHLFGGTQSRTSVNDTGVLERTLLSGRNFGSKLGGKAPSCSFQFEKELQVEGARLFDIDASNQIMLISRRLAGIGGTQLLTKMSLIPPYDRDDIVLPRASKTIRDLHLSPSNSDLALFSCLGKKLSVLSMESNNIILAYNLPAAAWSCSWDLNDSNYVYAGLQNGSLLVFDMRLTAGPVESMRGLTNNPVHTVHSLSHSSALPSGTRTVMSASSIGLCLWNFGSGEAEKGPILVPQTDNQGICISLAYCPTTNDIVASYRPKVEMTDEIVFSQPPLTPSRGIGQGTLGSHVHLKRSAADGSCFQRFGSAATNVCDIGLPKSAIINVGNRITLFALEDNFSSELVLEELPSLTTFQRLKLPKSPVCDLKYTPALNYGLLNVLSGDKLQVFSTLRL